MFGRDSKRLMGVATRVKKCRKCALGHSKDDHDCRKIFSVSAKAMEPDMAVQLIDKHKLLKRLNAKVTRVMGDDDASVMAAVQRESDEAIEKWSDFNHAKKAFTSALYNMKLAHGLIQYFGSCFSTAIQQNKDNPNAVEAALKNILPHTYGEHTNCGDWCGYKELGDNYVHKYLPDGKPLSDPQLRLSLDKLFERFAENSNKLAPCGSSQPNESFNQMVTCKIPKK